LQDQQDNKPNHSGSDEVINILFLSEQFYPFGSGAELATFEYASLLRQEGFNVVVVTNSFSENRKIVKQKNLTIHYLPIFTANQSPKYSMLKRSDLLFSSFLSNLFDWADVVYVPRFWFLAIPFAKRHKKPVVVHLHDYVPICPLVNIYARYTSKASSCNKLSCIKCVYNFETMESGTGNLRRTFASTTMNLALRNLFPKLIEHSDAIVCVSKAQKDIILQNAPQLANKTSVIYNPTSNQPNITDEGYDFGYFGGLNYLKGFQVLHNSVINDHKFTKWPERIHCTKFSSNEKQLALTLNKSGFLLYGKLDQTEYADLYKKVQKVIVPSLWPEPWPYVVVEALLSGRFVIASRIGGIPEQVLGCKGTLLFEAGDAEKLGEAISYVHGLRREAVIDLGFQNREAFRRRFSNEVSLDQFISVLEHLV
jgi:glycosyltransferase involved in cell wall biosynthesis